MREIIILDTETSGIGEKGRVLELAYIHAKGEKYTSFQTLSKVAHITPQAMATHHITPEMIADKQDLKETLQYQFLCEELNKENNILVGHNIQFDIGMLEKEGFKNKMTVIDTLKCSKILAPGLSSYSLQFLRYFLGIYKQEEEMLNKLHLDSLTAHSALGDVVVTLLIFERLKAKFGIDKLIETTASIPKDVTLTFGKYKGMQLGEVFMRDEGYIRWLSENAKEDEITRIAKELLNGSK